MKNLHSLIATLETLTNEYNIANKSKAYQAEMTFQEIVNNQIDNFVNLTPLISNVTGVITNFTSENISFSTYINQAIDIEIDSTMKPSIINLLELMRYILLNAKIKHNLISFVNAKKLFKEKLSRKELASIVGAEMSVYNDNITKVLEKKTLDRMLELRAENTKMTATLKKMDIEELLILKELLGFEIKETKWKDKSALKQKQEDESTARKNEIKRAKMKKIEESIK